MQEKRSQVAMDKHKVYIIDDSLVFRAMLETIVSQDPGFEVCGIAASVGQALRDLGRLLPDIILLDLNFREGPNGLAFLDGIDDHWHTMHVVIVSIDAKRDSDSCKEAFRRGAAACFDKAQAIASGRELIALMHDLADRVDPHAQGFGRAITLPAARPE